jgi:hypothetical protein
MHSGSKCPETRISEGPEYGCLIWPRIDSARRSRGIVLDFAQISGKTYLRTERCRNVVLCVCLLLIDARLVLFKLSFHRISVCDHVELIEC